jgi:hypothetical protein
MFHNFGGWFESDQLHHAVAAIEEIPDQLPENFAFYGNA